MAKQKGREKVKVKIVKGRSAGKVTMILKERYEALKADGIVVHADSPAAKKAVGETKEEKGKTI